MIEIFNTSDIQKVEDKKVKEYLEYSFSRLPEDYKYPEYGYFVILEDFEDMFTKIVLQNYELPSIQDGLFESINMVEENEELLEVLVLVDNDESISFIIQKDLIPENYLEELLSYKI